MKIFEIIEPKNIVRNLSTKFDPEQVATDLIRHNREYRARPERKKSKLIKRGAFSKGRQNIQDPFMFTKTTVKPNLPEDDPYLEYVKAITPYMGSNPYFPRIYVVKQVKDSEGQVKTTYQIEKLMDWSALSTDDEGRLDIIQHIANRALYRPLKRHPMDNLYTIATAITFNNIRLIKDPLLKQAIKVINSVSKEFGFEYDMHEGNFLYRPTPQGVQLVISDPLVT